VFAIVLCASRHLFVQPVIVMDQHAWARAHVEAFEFFGGIPARIVADNLKTEVDKPDLYDAEGRIVGREGLRGVVGTGTDAPVGRLMRANQAGVVGGDDELGAVSRTQLHE
jgi:hypothetical protein